MCDKEKYVLVILIKEFVSLVIHTKIFVNKIFLAFIKHIKI